MGTKKLTITNSDMRKKALALRKLGLGIIPIRVDGSKSPDGLVLPNAEWGPYKLRLPTCAEIAKWFPDDQRAAQRGIGIVGGSVSGRLEILDIDSLELATPFRRKLDEIAPGLYEQLVRVKTPRPGMHLYYRVLDGQTKSGKLARKPVVCDGKLERKTLIESKGQGGYVLAPGNPPNCHKTGRQYLLLKGPSLKQIPQLTFEEYECIRQAAKSFDLVKHKQPVRLPMMQRKIVGFGCKPWEEFNAKASWWEILEPHGWSIVKIKDDGSTYWRHPAASANYSAVTGPEDGDSYLRVFSTNTVFDDVLTENEATQEGSCYSKFDAFKRLNYQDDFHAALRAIERLGYDGEPDLPFLQQAPPKRGQRRRRRNI